MLGCFQGAKGRKGRQETALGVESDEKPMASRGHGKTYTHRSCLLRT